MEPESELSNLRYAIVNRTPFLPGQRFLSLPMLAVVIGVTWSEACRDCMLVKTDEIDNLTRDLDWEMCKVTVDHFQFIDEVKYGLSAWYFKNGFSSQCLCVNERCENEEINTPYDKELNMLIRNLFHIEYLLGSIAIVANLVVTLTIVLSRKLHKPSFILICNVALCDMLMGVYAVLIGRFTVYELIVHSEEYPNMDVFVNHYCSVMGFIFTTSQLVSVTTSLLMTFERYLGIVYCMHPNRRLRRRHSLILCIVFWCCGISYSALAIGHVGGLRYHGEYQCMLPFVHSDNIHDVSTSTLVLAIVLVLAYIVSLCLYIPIYRYVNNTSVSVGIKRKATLAKNIAIMISTNCVFFFVPLISTLIFVYFYSKFMEFLKVDTMRELQVYFIFLSWLPVVLLGINSCLNPFLCAFRHPQFKDQIKTVFAMMNRRQGTSRRSESYQSSEQQQHHHVTLHNLSATRDVTSQGMTNQAVTQDIALDTNTY